MPFVDFTAGDVFTAANADTLMRQGVMVFDSVTDRNTQLTGVLAEGMRAYTKDQNREWVYDGLNWVCVSSPWTTYTPGLTNAVLGNGTLNFTYRYAGWKSVHVRGRWTLGSTSSVSGIIGFSYPDSTTPATTPQGIGHAWLIDNSSSDQGSATVQAASTLAVYTFTLVATDATTPFTWATGDAVSIDIIFEIN